MVHVDEGSELVFVTHDNPWSTVPGNEHHQLQLEQPPSLVHQDNVWPEVNAELEVACCDRSRADDAVEGGEEVAIEGLGVEREGVELGLR